jgi:hypothetical protein
VIFAYTNIFAGVEVRAALPHDDVTRDDVFTAIPLHTQALCVAITSVAAGAATFFMSHDRVTPDGSKLDVDRIYAKARVILAVTHCLAVIGALPIVENLNFLTPELLNHRHIDRGTIDQWLTDDGLIAVADEQHIGNAEAVVNVVGELVYINDGADFGAVLTTALLDDGVHLLSLQSSLATESVPVSSK